MLFYSWQLAIAVCVMLVPLLIVVGTMQKRLSAAFDTARTRVGELLSEVSESVMGAAVVRAYGLDEQTHSKVEHAINERYKAEVVAHFRAATLWPLSSVFYAAALSVVIALGAFFGPAWALTFGQVGAFLFLADVFLHVFTDLPEIYSETQNAIAAWRKILAVHDLPVDVVEPSPGTRLEGGALAVRAEDVRYRYRTGPEVLHGISLDVPAGGHVAIVGETGCGKHVFTDLPEIYSETQNAIAAWRKTWRCTTCPSTSSSPRPARARGRRARVRAEDVRYRYRTGPEVLHGSPWRCPRAGTSPSSGRPAAGRRRSPSSWPGWPTRRAAGS